MLPTQIGKNVRTLSVGSYPTFVSHNRGGSVGSIHQSEGCIFIKVTLDFDISM